MNLTINGPWIFATKLEAIPQDDVVAVQIEDREIALYRVSGEVFATDNQCTHGNARLCDGMVESGEIECPLHQGRFDIRSGRALCRPLKDNLRIYPVKLEDDHVYIQLD